MDIFPESSLAVSLITTIWVGLFVISFFNLRLGWNISGLIVPGYLVPLIILKPWSAVAIIIEAVFTYLAVKGFSKLGEKTGLWSELFGRDRFFAMLLVSVAARLLFDESIFPCITAILSQHFEIDFLYRDGLYSIGLVIVALTANQFWTSGLRRGSFQLIITLVVTFLIVKYILIGLTNFRLSEVANLYENLATSILASPKAYIILITTAFIASRMSSTYGWEFSGIAIPALLALLWYYPWEIFISIAEAVIIYFIAVLILKTKFMSNFPMEGSRKILFFFNISFFYKLALGFLLPLFIIDISPTDYFGFGYMLTSLIAVKMYEKEFGARIIGSTIFTSGISVILATLIGFALTFVEHRPDFPDTVFSEKKSEIKTGKISSNIPLKLRDKVPPVLSSSPLGRIQTDIKARKLSLAELKFIDEKILNPVVELSGTKSKNSTSLEKELNSIALSSDSLGIKMTLFGNKAFHPDYVELKGSYPEQFLGTFYFRLSSGSEIILESDSLSKRSLELARILEDKFKPRAVLFPALFARNYDSLLEAEAPIKYTKGSFFDLANQVSIREMDKKKAHGNVVQIKTSIGKKDLEANTVYVSTNSGAYSLDTLNKTQKEICDWILSKNYKVKFVSGSGETAGLETTNLISGRYLEMTDNTSLIVLWLSR
ncbi:MAG: poly-gamma-glutamate biosynthesis protein PgsC/CapC [Lentisphaerota bacterium]